MANIKRIIVRDFIVLNNEISHWESLSILFGWSTKQLSQVNRGKNNKQKTIIVLFIRRFTYFIQFNSIGLKLFARFIYFYGFLFNFFPIAFSLWLERFKCINDSEPMSLFEIFSCFVINCWQRAFTAFFSSNDYPFDDISLWFKHMNASTKQTFFSLLVSFALKMLARQIGKKEQIEKTRI